MNTTNRKNKIDKRLKRKQRELNRLKKLESRPQMIFWGVLDGAPDDQLAKNRPPSTPHALVVVIGPSIERIGKFIKKIEEYSGKEGFKIRKWNGSSRDRKASYQSSFIRGFARAFTEFDDIHIHGCIASAWSIYRMFWLSLEYHAKIRTLIEPLNSDSDPCHCKVSSFVVKTEGETRVIDSFNLSISRAAVVVWQSMILRRIYEHAWNGAGQKPIWNLVCDRLPGDPNCRGVLLQSEILSDLHRSRLAIFTPVDGRKDDTPEEYLADCVVTWIYDWFKDPDSINGKAWASIVESNYNSRRIQIDLINNEKGQPEDWPLPEEGRKGWLPLKPGQNWSRSNALDGIVDDKSSSQQKPTE